LPSRRLECPRRVETALTPSGTLGIAFTPSGVSQMYWNGPHAIWDVWDYPHTVCSVLWSVELTLTLSGASRECRTHPHAIRTVLDALEPPSRCLGRLGLPSRRLGRLGPPSCRLGLSELPSCYQECPRHVVTALMLGTAFTLSRVSQTRWNGPHAIWDAWNFPHAVCSVPDWLKLSVYSSLFIAFSHLFNVMCTIWPDTHVCLN
jgi:hypothetical protein